MCNKLKIVVLLFLLFSGCNLDEVVSDFSLYQSGEIGKVIFRVTRNDVTFTGIQTGTNQIRVNMINRTGVAKVSYTITTYTSASSFYNTITRTATLYSNIEQHDTFYLPTFGLVSFIINSITR